MAGETATEEEATEEEKLHDKLAGFDLTVHPNPTKGEVVVEIIGKACPAEGWKIMKE